MTRNAILILLPLLVQGCFNPLIQIDARTAMEQQLTRTAIIRAIDQLAIHKDVLTGEWGLQILAPNSRDESLIRGRLRDRLATLGAKVHNTPKDGASLISAWVIYAGTDIDNFYIGIPLPGLGYQTLSFYQSITARGRAEISLTFSDRTGKPFARTGSAFGGAHFTDLYFLTFIGPFSLTDLETETPSRLLELGKDTWRRTGQMGSWIVPAGRSDSSRSNRESNENESGKRVPDR
jgi:hypothetical protein